MNTAYAAKRYVKKIAKKFGLKIDESIFKFAANPTGPEGLQSGQDVPLGFGRARERASL